MNKRLSLLFLVIISLSFLPGAGAADRWETLRAINLVENPTNQTRLGSRGELGPYQFRVSTWRMHTRKPFSLATDRATADEVAISHFEWIKRGLTDAGIDPNPYNIAMAWNCGLSAVVGGRVPAESYVYAEQVSNLAEAFNQRARAEALAAAPVPVRQPSDFQLKFTPATDAPHFVLLAKADIPTVTVAAESSAFVIAPATIRFSLALVD